MGKIVIMVVIIVMEMAMKEVMEFILNAIEVRVVFAFNPMHISSTVSSFMYNSVVRSIKINIDQKERRDSNKPRRRVIEDGYSKKIRIDTKDIPSKSSTLRVQLILNRSASACAPSTSIERPSISNDISESESDFIGVEESLVDTIQ